MNPRQRHQPPAFPEAIDGDEDDVAWALSTGGVEWRRGAHADALQWLRRAIDSAREHHHSSRARDLEFRGRTLQVALEVGWVSTPPSAPSPASPAANPRIPGPPPAPSTRASVRAGRTLPREEDAVELDSEELLDFDDDGTDALDDADEEYADVRASEVELDQELDLVDEADVVLLPTEPPPAASVLPGAQSSAPPMENSAPPALPNAPRRPPSHPPPREAFPPPPVERELGDLIDAPELEFRESERRAPEPTLVDTPLTSSPSDAPAGAPEPEYFEPSSLVPPEPIEEEPTDRDLEPTERELEPIPPPDPESGAAAARVKSQAPPPPSSSGLFPSVPPLEGSDAFAEVPLSNVAGLQDLPEEAQEALVERARLKDLEPEEEVRGFGLALVLDGSVSVMPTVADVAVAHVPRGQPVVGQGNLPEGVPLRIVASSQGARVALWSASELKDAVRECPWVGDELKSVGDRFQALAGVTLGPLGESLDDVLRGMVIERCEVLLFFENELVAEKGKALSGMFVVGGGHLEIVPGDAPNGPAVNTLGSGDFLFPSQILQATPAPAHARAGKGGTLGLFAPRPVAHELMLSVPPLLELFAR